MSFLSQHIAQQTGTVDPVAGKGSPHHGEPHHQVPAPAPEIPHRVVMGANHKEVRETAYEHQEYPRAVHHHGSGKSQVVHSKDEHEALGEGWVTEAPKEK